MAQQDDTYEIPAWDETDAEQQAALAATTAVEELAAEEEVCDYCGKPLGEFSDLGCARCDRRVR